MIQEQHQVFFLLAGVRQQHQDYYIFASFLRVIKQTWEDEIFPSKNRQEQEADENEWCKYEGWVSDGGKALLVSLEKF